MKILKIIIFGIVFALILAVAVGIVALSLAVAPEAAKSNGWGRMAIALSGLGVAGGVVYLGEKLFNFGWRVGEMVLELVVERYKQRRLEAGIKIGEERERQATHAWYERQQAAFRAGLPFDEPPPGYDPKERENGKAAD